MGQEVAVRTGGAVSVDLSKLDHKLGLATIERLSAKVGVSGSKSQSMWPGLQLSFKSGQFTLGFGDKAQKIAEGRRFVFNVPNTALAWQTWLENDSGKRYPKTTDPAIVMLGHDLPDRDELGQTDEDEWETDNAGRPQDPWKTIMVMPIREEDGEAVNHVMLSTVSALRAGFNLFRDAIDEMKMRPGQLPVVEVGAAKAEREVEVEMKDRKGNAILDKQGNPKTRKEKQVWDIPTFEIVDWVDATEADERPNGVPVMSDDGDEADVGEVKTTARAETKKPSKVEKSTKAAPKGARRRVADEDDSL